MWRSAVQQRMNRSLNQRDVAVLDCSQSSNIRHSNCKLHPDIHHIVFQCASLLAYDSVLRAADPSYGAIILQHVSAHGSGEQKQKGTADAIQST